ARASAHAPRALARQEAGPRAPRGPVQALQVGRARAGPPRADAPARPTARAEDRPAAPRPAPPRSPAPAPGPPARALQPVQASTPPLAPACRADELALDPITFAEQRLQLLRGAVAGDSRSLTALLGRRKPPLTPYALAP